MEWPAVNLRRHPEDRPGGQIFGAPPPKLVLPAPSEADFEWLEQVSEWLRSTEPEKRRDISGPLGTPEIIAERLAEEDRRRSVRERAEKADQAIAGWLGET